MTDDDTAGPAAPFTIPDLLADERGRRRLAAELHLANKTALFDALAATAIVSVEIAFDGVGDAGQIGSIDAVGVLGATGLPDQAIPLRRPSHDGQSVVTSLLPVQEFLEQMAYDLLEETHSGWENDAGAYGTFTFDVAARTICLDHHERYEQTFDTSHEF